MWEIPLLADTRRCLPYAIVTHYIINFEVIVCVLYYTFVSPDSVHTAQYLYSHSNSVVTACVHNHRVYVSRSGPRSICRVNRHVNNCSSDSTIYYICIYIHVMCVCVCMAAVPNGVW